MALPSLGETYSLLADVRTSDIKRQRDEERRYRKDARRDQLKAALLQPIVGAVATTGMKVLGDVVGGAFLGSNAVKKVTQQEEFRRLNTDVAFQERARKGISSLAAKVTEDPAKFKQDQIILLRNQLAIDDYGQINYADLTTHQKFELSQRIADPVFQKTFNETTTDLIKKIQEFNAEISTQFNAPKVSKFIKENPDLYSTKSGGEKLFSSALNKLASFVPGIEDRDRMRESYSIKLYGTKDEESLNDKQKGNLDWLMGSTAEGTPVTGQGARNHALYKEYKSEYDGLYNNFYSYLKESKTNDKINESKTPGGIGAGVASVESMSMAALRVHQVNPNSFTSAFFEQREKHRSTGLYKQGVPFPFDPSTVFFTGEEYKNPTGTLRAAGPEFQERYNEVVKRLAENSGLSQDQIAETLQNNVFPTLKLHFSDALNDMFRGTTYKGNAFNLIGSLNKSDQQALFGEFLVRALEENVISVIPEAGFFSSPEGASRIGIARKDDYHSNNTARILSILNQDPNTFTSAKNVSRPSQTNSTVSTTPVKPLPSFAEIQGTVIGLTVRKIEDMKKDGKSREEIENFVLESEQLMLQRTLDSGVKVFEDELEISKEQFSDLKEISLTNYPQSNTSAGSSVTPGVNTKDSSSSLLKIPDRFDNFSPDPDRRSILGDIKNVGSVFQERRLRNMVGNLQQNPRPPEEFFQFNDILNMSGVTPELMKEVGFTDEYIQYAQQITKDTSNSLLASPSLSLVNPNVPGLNEIISSSIEKFSPTNINPNIVKVVSDIETERWATLEGKSSANSGHDAHGVMQVKTATAVQPGYGSNTIFSIADNLNISYDENLKDEAAQQMTANFKAGTFKPVTGKAADEVIRLLQIPEVNIGLGTNLLSSYFDRYEGDMEKTLIAYNQGPTVADNYKGDRNTLPSEGKGYVEKAEDRGLLLKKVKL